MKEKTETLAVGDRAPEFTLPAANQEGTFSLSQWLRRGPLILEFLRGTW
jgi:peroxiredoxin